MFMVLTFRDDFFSRFRPQSKYRSLIVNDLYFKTVLERSIFDQFRYDFAVAFYNVILVLMTPQCILSPDK